LHIGITFMLGLVSDERNSRGRGILINLVHDALHGLARHMYHTLTSIYAALYKTTTPLAFDWRKEDIYELLGHDDTLVKAFDQIKAEISKLCKATPMTGV
jgi:hypothetical protein